MIFSSNDILSPSQLRKLTEHRYSSSGSTILDPLVQLFWNWLVTKLPIWLSPNLMTITGLFVNIFTSLILIFYSPDAVQEAPRWTFVLCALGMFIYQTLDACDGKQARRTGTSSPLGELFDHGCDSLSTVFVSLGVCIATELGTYPAWMFFQCFAAMTLFYCAHWQTYVSGTLHFGKFDVTEVQFTIIIILLVSAILGPGVWSTRIPFFYIELKLLPVIIGASAASFSLCGYFTVIFTGGAGKNGSTVAGTSVLSPFIPVGLVVIPAFIIYQKSVRNIYENHPCLYILAFGIVSAKVTNRLVVAHMTKSVMEYFDSILIGPGMLFLNQYFNTFINEYIVLWLCLVYSLADLLHYCIIVCNQICSHLHIKMFQISPRLIAD
ncbi:choline/ethanolaminephosphotransferase 1-like isoform X2 [Centruroides sculpturatus]|nr:choline/ethanolaminephosphotransferase 1-like isoform X2 [Centruroides sculpturatus]